MTRQELQQSRLATARLARDTAGLEVIARMKNSPVATIALLAISNQSPGWEHRYVTLRGRMTLVQGAALDKFKALCQDVREMEIRYEVRNRVRQCPGSSTVNHQKDLCPHH